MKKLLYTLPIMALLLVSVASASVFFSDTKWSARGSVGLADTDNFYGKDLIFSKGRYNAHFNLKRDIAGSGFIYAQVKTVDGERDRLSVRWSSRVVRSCGGSSWRNTQCGTYGGLTLLEDTDTRTIFLADSRVIRNRQFSFGVPVTITFMKATGEFTVEANNGDFKFSA